MIGISKPTCERFKERLIIDVAIGGNPEEFDYYHSESEVQQRIEAAVAEHVKSEKETEYSNELTHRGEISQWRFKCNGLEDENKQLQARIAELEAERQPVEVSAELAGAIEAFKKQYGEKWEYYFLTNSSVDCEFLKTSNRRSYETYFDAHESTLVNIIKRGYTVKPDPLRTRIAAILGNNHEQLDAVVAAVREGEAE